MINQSENQRKTTGSDIEMSLNLRERETERKKEKEKENVDDYMPQIRFSSRGIDFRSEVGRNLPVVD